MFNLSLKRGSVVDLACLLLLPLIFLFLWIYGVPLKILLPAVVLLCVIICLVGSYIMTRIREISVNDSDNL